VLQPDLQRRRNNGIQVRPDLSRASDVLRMGMLLHLVSARTDTGADISRANADMATELSRTQLVTTQDLAHRLDVTARHARRIAQEEGIEPAARNAWDPEDVAALVANRRTTA
jgi:hypothetical protein